MKLRYYFVCVSVPVFVCAYTRLGGWVHACGGQAVPIKWVTWPMHAVAEGFLSSFLSNSLTLLPSKPLFCPYTCLSLYLCPDLCEMYTEAHVSAGSFKRRARSAGQTIEEIPQAHMELVRPVLTLRGILQLSELWGGIRIWVGKKRK